MTIDTLNRDCVMDIHRNSLTRYLVFLCLMTVDTEKIVFSHMNIDLLDRFGHRAIEITMFDSITTATVEMAVSAIIAIGNSYTLCCIQEIDLLTDSTTYTLIVYPWTSMTDQAIHVLLGGEVKVQIFPAIAHMTGGTASEVRLGGDTEIIQDIFLTPTAELAHVVLPGTSFAEKDGTFTNTERRVMRVRQAIEPVGDSRPDWQILQELSTRFGYEMKYDSPQAIMEEIAGLTPSYGGITYERLEGEGLQWPCPDKDHLGTKFLHKDKIARGKGLFHAIEFKPPAESVDEQYPFWLTTGRVYVHYHTGTMTRNCPTLDAEIPEGLL